MSWTLSTASGALNSAGDNVNATISADTTTLALWSDEAEALCSNTARKDLVTNYSSITSFGRQILSSICSAYIAQKIINYEPEAIGLTGASLRLNLLQTQLSTGLNQIENDNIKTYLKINS